MHARIFSALRRPQIFRLGDRAAILSWAFVNGEANQPDRLECSVAYEALGFRRETTVEIPGDAADGEQDYAEKEALNRAMLGRRPLSGTGTLGLTDDRESTTVARLPLEAEGTQGPYAEFNTACRTSATIFTRYGFVRQARKPSLE